MSHPVPARFASTALAALFASTVDSASSDAQAELTHINLTATGYIEAAKAAGIMARDGADIDASIDGAMVREWRTKKGTIVRRAGLQALADMPGSERARLASAEHAGQWAVHNYRLPLFNMRQRLTGAQLGAVVQRVTNLSDISADGAKAFVAALLDVISVDKAGAPKVLKGKALDLATQAQTLLTISAAHQAATESARALKAIGVDPAMLALEDAPDGA